MKVRYTPTARNDLEAIYLFLDKRSPATAQVVKRTIERRIAQLADFPLIAPVTDIPDVREMTVVRFPYKIYYLVDNDEVRILHIRHTSRRPPGEFGF